MGEDLVQALQVCVPLGRHPNPHARTRRYKHMSKGEKEALWAQDRAMQVRAPAHHLPPVHVHA